MSYVTTHRPDFGLPWTGLLADPPDPRSGTLVQSISSANANTNTHNLTLPGSPTGTNPLFALFGVESGVITVSSITQTGATWTRLTGSTNGSTSIELWATPAATGTGITVSMSAGNWSGVSICEVSGVKPSVNEALFSSSYRPYIVPRYGVVLLATARRAGGSGGSFGFAGSSGSHTGMVNLANYTAAFASPAPRAWHYTGTTGSQFVGLFSLPAIST